MAHDLLSEPRVTLTQAAKHYGVHVATLHRWRLRGVRGVRLESYCLGGLRFTTLPALERFSAACTAAADGMTHAPVRTTRQREAAIAAAERELASV